MWAKLRSEALVALKKDLYAPMTAAEARLTLENRQLGVSKLRLIPKSKGARRWLFWRPACSAVTPLVQTPVFRDKMPASNRVCPHRMT